MATSSRYSHMSAYMPAAGDHTVRDPGVPFRSREQERADRLDGFQGVQQGLSHRERMTDAGRNIKFLRNRFGGML